VRKLVHDLGLQIGGAHLTALQRTGIGPFSRDLAAPLDRIRKNPEQHAKPLEYVLDKAGIKKVSVKESAVRKVQNGALMRKEDMRGRPELNAGETIALYSKGHIIALGMTGKEAVRPYRVFKEEKSNSF
jgi:tRNA U55 pseudouridine synthase TruB